MDRVLSLLLEGESLTVGQMSEVLGLSEAEVEEKLEELKRQKVLLGWRPVLNPSAGEGQLVRAAIEELPETYRTVVVLRDLEELSTEETARVLKISEGAVRVRLHRARQALRALLDRHFGEES